MKKLNITVSEISQKKANFEVLLLSYLVYFYVLSHPNIRDQSNASHLLLINCHKSVLKKYSFKMKIYPCI